MRKNLAVCSWSLQPTGPSELAESILRTGLSRTQLAIERLLSDEWDLHALKECFAKHSIEICSGMMTTIGEDYSTLGSIKLTGGLRPDEHWDRNLARTIRTAQIAHSLDVKLMTLHAGFIPQRHTIEYRIITGRIKIVNEEFQNHGIALALETGQERAEDLLEMLDLPNMETVGVNFDPANMILYGMGDPADAIELLKHRISQVHMKDAVTTTTPGTWGQEVPVGQGEVDWGQFFRVVDALPQSIDVVIEREAGEDRVNDIIAARKIAQRSEGAE